MWARIPSSSSSSRRKAAGASSPGSILPPGNSHFSGSAWYSVRWQQRISSPRTMSAAATCLVNAASIPVRGRPSRVLLQVLPNQRRAMLDELAGLRCERSRSVAVNVEFADHLALHEHRRHDLGAGLEGARKITRIGVDVVNHDGLS